LDLGLSREVVLGSVIEFLLGDGLLFGERPVTIYVELGPTLIRLGYRKLGLGLNQLRLRLCQLAIRLGHLSLCLVQGSLEGARIDLEEQLPLVNEGPLRVGLLQKVTGDLRFDV